MQAILITLMLLGAAAPAEAEVITPPAPPCCHHRTSDVVHRQWLPRYTIREGTHYVRPLDYRRAFDYPWHDPRLPAPHVPEFHAPIHWYPAR